MNMRLLLLLLFASVFALSGYSQVASKLPLNFEAKVVKIFDGDTFDAVYKDSTYRFRLFDIDAPEFGQEFYAESKHFLSDLICTKYVTIDNKGLDKYGRTLGVVHRKDDTLNINRQLVKEGLAWNYTHYSTDTLLPKLESLAREKQIGIWSSYHYLEPWEFRRNH
jgi:endonuclease YncB( thermonuclease family)